MDHRKLIRWTHYASYNSYSFHRISGPSLHATNLLLNIDLFTSNDGTYPVVEDGTSVALRYMCWQRMPTLVTTIHRVGSDYYRAYTNDLTVLIRSL